MVDIEREQITITTPVGKKEIKLLAWLTGREKLKLSKIDRTDTEASSKSAVEAVVVGTSYDEIADMHGRDFDFIFEEITKVVQGSSLLPKAPSSSAPTPSS